MVFLFYQNYSLLIFTWIFQQTNVLNPHNQTAWIHTWIPPTNHTTNSPNPSKQMAQKWIWVVQNPAQNSWLQEAEL